MPVKDSAKRDRLRSHNLRITIQNIKAGRPCLDCGGIFPHYVMDFDHRDPTTKDAGISKLAGRGRRSRVLVEIQKCDLICANCHRIRTFQQKHFLNPTNTIDPDPNLSLIPPREFM